MRRFAGIDLGEEPVPDETTLCRFRHRLERHELGKPLFEQVHRHLEGQGIRIAKGTIVDATILSAPSSTRNEKKARDPDMPQTRKGNPGYFGMKGHFGVDSRTKLIHRVVATPANLHLERAKDRTRSSVRARVEHAIGVIQRIFGFVKVRYRGLAKNANRQFATCALANLYRVRRRLLRPAGA